MSNVNLAIVGSRNFNDWGTFLNKINQALETWGLTPKDINRVISGGARGADTLADVWAKDNNIPMTTFIPDWKALGKRAGIMRNTDIVNDCTHMVAFPSKQGKGTQDSIRKANNSTPPKNVIVFYID